MSLTFPPFPDDIPTHPLFVVDYKLIKAGDRTETDRLWEAATKLGFWYLKNHGVDEEVTGMFEMGEETMALPLEEKMKFEQGDEGMFFGYKAAGTHAVDATGKKDLPEFINVAKDDALAWPKIARREYPAPTNRRMESTIIPFHRKSMEINYVLLDVFNERLGLPPGKLREKHRVDEFSGSESRVIKVPPTPPTKEPVVAIGGHRDLGTLSFLHNRTGGLQVLVPGAETWQYVKPLPGHAICNIGDTLALFSGGILRSNMHRVVTPPGRQREVERWSLVFFTRPGNSIPLRALIEDSPLIAETVKNSPPGKFETGMTALEWFRGMVKNVVRINSAKGPESMANGGMQAIKEV